MGGVANLKGIAELGADIRAEDYGNKAYWISWLFSKGYRVPPAIFIPAVARNNQIRANSRQFRLIEKRLERLRRDGSLDLAVRSSATCEDIAEGSLAGHFKTFLGQMDSSTVLRHINQIIRSLSKAPSHSCSMGVVIQQRIDSSFAGVIFSSDPVSGSKSDLSLGVVQGMGESLVSGRQPGKNVLIHFEDGQLEDGKDLGIRRNQMLEICRMAKDIERKLDRPVDIEWCVEKTSGNVYALQCRPATGILFDRASVITIDLDSIRSIPPQLSTDPKIAIRLLGEKAGILVSKAHLILVNCLLGGRESVDLNSIETSQYCKGYSVVLLQPARIEGKVIRSFAAKSPRFTELKLFLEGCQRYQIRSYPETRSLAEAIERIVGSVENQFWACAIVVQEIFNPAFTGVLQKIPEGFVIEVARGHFVPKGIVPTSLYIIDHSKQVSFAHKARQSKVYRILDGHIVEEELRGDERLVDISPQQLRDLATKFEPVLTNTNTSVEFGILQGTSGSGFLPYLIDLVENEEAVQINRDDIMSGVISRGQISGRLTIVNKRNPGIGSLNVHLHDKVAEGKKGIETRIFYCNSPDISLLSLISQYSSGEIGFVFREGSVLAHLSIVLRERGIPAVVTDSLDKTSPGTLVQLDATTPGLSGDQRVKILEMKNLE